MSKEARTYRKRFLIALSKSAEIVSELQALRATFDPLKHGLRLYTVYSIPQETILTKKGTISRKGGDIDNYLKLTTDFLCNDKYLGHEFPNCTHPDIENLGIDDQFILDYDSSKRVSTDNEYHIDFIIELCSITDISQQMQPVLDSRYTPEDSE